MPWLISSTVAQWQYSWNAMSLRIQPLIIYLLNQDLVSAKLTAALHFMPRLQVNKITRLTNTSNVNYSCCLAPLCDTILSLCLEPGKNNSCCCDHKYSPITRDYSLPDPGQLYPSAFWPDKGTWLVFKHTKQVGSDLRNRKNWAASMPCIIENFVCVDTDNCCYLLHSNATVADCIQTNTINLKSTVWLWQQITSTHALWVMILQLAAWDVHHHTCKS